MNENRRQRRKRERFLASISESEKRVKERWLKTCAWALGKTEVQLSHILAKPKERILDYPGSPGVPVSLSRTDIDAVQSALIEIRKSKPRPINPEDDGC